MKLISSSVSVPDEGHWPAGTLVRTLAPASRAALLTLGAHRQYDSGDIVLREMDQSTHVVLLCDAVVKITSSLENGRIALLGMKVGGDVVGEMAALSGAPRCATVTACGTASVRVISRNEFVAYLRDFPDAHLALTRMIMDRLRWADKRRIDFNGYPVFVRLARILVELADEYGRQAADGITFDVGLTQRELGALVGAEEDTARKELRKLRDRGVINLGYRATTIVDRVALEVIAYDHLRPSEFGVPRCDAVS
jgi:CRP/FNR family transcriptional regulator, cyclic AMP receptor protein